MKKVFLMVLVAGSLAACNNGTDGSASGDSAVLTTPSTVDSVVTTPLDSAAVAPMVDTTTAGTGAANSGASGLGTTGSGTTNAADSTQK